MATINRAELVKSLIDKAKINTSVEATPTKLAEKIVPVMEVQPNPKISIMSINVSDSASGVIITCSTELKTFLHFAYISISKDIVSDSIFSEIKIVPKGATSEEVLRLRYEPVTAGQFNSNLIFSVPIELEKGSQVHLINNTATASIDATGIVGYSTEED